MKKLILTALLSSVMCSTAGAEMPNMNATDHVYGYHLRDVYKDMEQLNNNVKNDISNLYSKVDNIKQYDDDISNLYSKVDNIKQYDDDISNLYSKVDNIKQYDDTAIRGDINAINNKLNTIDSTNNTLSNSISNITSDIADTSNRIDKMENSINNSINNITSDMGVIKNDVENNKHSINSLESTTHQLTNNISGLRNDVDGIRSDLNHLKSDTHKGLAQANALSSLKYVGGKGLQLSVGLGGYRGTSAIAYGLFYGVNDDLLLYAGGTDNSYNASINVRIGGK